MEIEAPTPQPANVDPGEAQAPTPEQEYAQLLQQAGTQIDALVDDPTVVWTPEDRNNPDANRSTQTTVPGPAGTRKNNINAKITVIDEADQPRWYLVHLTSQARPKDAGRVIVWSKGRDQASTRLPNSREYQRTRKEELGIVTQVTDANVAAVARRKPEVSADRREELGRSGRVAHLVGRMMGARNVTNFREPRR